MKNNIGIIGMAVMGKNMALNFAEHGFKTSVFNRTPEVIDELRREIAQENFEFAQNIDYFKKLEDFVNSLARPRKILLLIKAGVAVDLVIEKLLPLLDPKDIIIDGGNSFYRDSQRRYEFLKEKNIAFIGMGISGGKKGARTGPALMPSADNEVYEKVSDLFENICAKHDGEPCCKLISRGGAGHYLKMVHNGIEYADMQLIAESYFLLKKLFSLSNSEIADIFEEWNRGKLESYLIKITANILREKDSRSENDLIDMIMDITHQKGTGKWTNIEAIELGVDISIISAGLNARFMSLIKDERKQASQILFPYRYAQYSEIDLDRFKSILEDSLYMSKIMAYSQGFKLLKSAGDKYGWNFDFAKIACIFKEGSIIKAKILEEIEKAYLHNPDLDNLMFDFDFSKSMNNSIGKLRILISEIALLGIAAPAFLNALGYYDSYISEDLSANLVSAQRNYFGGHKFERIDLLGEFTHEWKI